MRLASAVLILALALGPAIVAHAQIPSPADAGQIREPGSKQLLKDELRDAAVRLPLAMLLGTVLALRPRRKGLPPRSLAVIETQVILAVVGAVVMLVVGASLARAFGIVGVAGLIRYRSKINDPKDAVVMLSALAVGLAAGCGLYALSAFSTLFLAVALGAIEAFEPRVRTFELSVKLADKTADLRPKIEEVLRRYHCSYEMRTVSEGEVSYVVTAPYAIKTDRVSKALIALEPGGKGAVEWKEIAKKEPK
ncbi:MAG TPA: DUF4956 domain-containing protein [Candidatus Polarisedimenticolaceae bacterium]|nr:DUF4956 domain-containing protein [Candidatus Polarisedimenticolaceae bacterium]